MPKARASEGTGVCPPWEILKIYSTIPGTAYPPFSEHFHRQEESKLVA